MRPGKRWFATIYRLVDRLQRRSTAEVRRDLVGDLAGDVLDVGCGPGTNFEHYPSNARVTAVDYNEHMLALAEATLARLPEPHARIRLRVADAERLPFADASFDAYVSTFVLCSVDDLDAAVEEAWRMLRPGGRARLFEHVRARSPWKARLQTWLSPAWGYFVDGCHLDRETDRAFLDRGFEVVESRRTGMRGEPMPFVVFKARKPG